MKTTTTARLNLRSTPLLPMWVGILLPFPMTITKQIVAIEAMQLVMVD